ncbi:Putative ribonuclease H protein At1g65750 [Linum grandiflorum]
MSVQGGRDTSFFHDIWMDNGRCLADLIDPVMIQSTDHFTVRDMVTNSGNWNWQLLNAIVPDDIRGLIQGMIPPHEDEEACFIWGLDAKGKFTIKSAYSVISGIDPANSQPNWRQLWQWRGPNRIMHFLWISYHNRLMTNAERHRRHISTTTTCPVSNQIEESATHALRDCSMARQIWIGMLGPMLAPTFFQQPLEEWLTNLSLVSFVG